MGPIRALFHPIDGRRAIVLALFVSALLLFRQLLVLFVFFVAFERPLGIASAWVAQRTGIRRNFALLLMVAALLGLVGSMAALGVGQVVDAAQRAREWVPDKIAELKETPLYRWVEEHGADAQKVLDAAKQYSAKALDYLLRAGHLLLHALIGFILAIVYLLEQEEIDSFERGNDPRSLFGTLLRWTGFVADAISVTLQFQIVVAACNAVLTFPVLLLVGIPHAVGFVFMIFVSGMVPVVGNFVAGAVLTLLAYQASGWTGVAAFTVLTFVLHKLESYYLNPRLAQRHVRLPGFVLIVSLVIWEHLLGFVGLFVSFPFLYVLQRIREEFKEEEEARPAAA